MKRITETRPHFGKRTAVLLLALLLLLTAATATGCDTQGAGGDLTSGGETLSPSPTDTPAGSDTPTGSDAPANSDAPAETDPPAPTHPVLAENGTARYKIVCSDRAGSGVIDLATTLTADLSDLAGAFFEASTDFVMPGTDPDAVSEYEILIGATNRSASGEPKDLGTDGWCVAVLGTRIVIDAKSVPSLSEAIAYFLSHVSVADGRVTFDPSDAKVEKKEYALIGKTLRVGSYNIKHGADVGLDFSVIAEDIKALGLDVVGFQEIDKCTRRVNGIDTPKQIAEALGFEYYYFTKAINFQDGEYGTLIVSRYPIESAESIAFPTHSGYENRAMGHAVIHVDGATVDFYNTHLSYEKAFLVEEQFEIVAETLKGKRGFLLTGDFNTEDSTYFEDIENGFCVNDHRYATFPSSGKYIDNIVAESGWQVNASGVGPLGHSDHILLWAELEYVGGV